MSDKKDAIVIDLVPEEVKFLCPDCGLQCVLHPAATPMNAQHALPVCESWRLGPGAPENEQRETTYQFLRRAKLPVLGGGKF